MDSRATARRGRWNGVHFENHSTKSCDGTRGRDQPPCAARWIIQSLIKFEGAGPFILKIKRVPTDMANLNGKACGLQEVQEMQEIR